MSKFDQYADTPFQISREGDEISVKLTRSDDSTGVISWNIPPKSAGCKSDQDGVYDGILITIDNTPTDSTKWPIDGNAYLSDPSANPQLHLGDKIGTSLVVGWFDRDRETIQTVVTDLDPTLSYYVTAHAFDNVKAYHTAGVHSYSTPYVSSGTLDKPSIQYVKLGNDGVNGGDTTGLSADVVYPININLNGTTHTITIDGSDALTYDQLVDQFNYHAKLINSPLQSPSIPNLNQLYFNSSSQQLMQWNGTQHTQIPALVSDEAPNILVIGDLWVDTSTSFNVVKRWDGTNWVSLITLTDVNDPNVLTCKTYWYDGSELFNWSGTSWVSTTLFTGVDPSLTRVMTCNSYWMDDDSDTLYKWDVTCKKWKTILAQYSDSNPALPALNHLWFNDALDTLNKYDGTVYQEIDVTVSDTQPYPVVVDGYWYNPLDMTLHLETSGVYNVVPFLLWDTDPTTPTPGQLWWDSTDDTLHQWDDSIDDWNPVTDFTISNIDPSTVSLVKIGDVWLTGTTYYKWDGSEWNLIYVLGYVNDPSTITINTVWFNPSTNIRYIWNGSDWATVIATISDSDPSSPSVNSYWYDSNDSTLYQFNGTAYVMVAHSTVPLTPAKGYQYYNLSTNQLMKWNGSGWVVGEPAFTVRLAEDNHVLAFETATVGSSAIFNILSKVGIETLFDNLIPSAQISTAKYGLDGVPTQPSYMTLGSGTDGTQDERRELIDSVRHQLGYPQVDVELTKQQFNYAIDGAIESLRKRSGSAYKRGYQLFEVQAGKQVYPLTDRRLGHNKIVEVLKIHRMTSAFMSQSTGQGLMHGQAIIQNLYSMGNYDLISYHMISQHIELMEQMFATQIMFGWDEDTRQLTMMQRFSRKERVLLEVAVERTEQSILKDRYLKGWVEKYAMVQCFYMLSQIRGKYVSLPGAGGGVQLNASELSARADMELMDLYEQLDNYLANQPEEWGMGSTFILG